MAIWTLLRCLFFAVACIYVLFGSLMYFSKDFRNALLFLHVFNVPLFANFSKPEFYGLDNAVNMHLNGSVGKLGAWFVKPKEQSYRGFFLYLHGNGGTRATSHRVGLYKLLSDLGFHVLVVDYRGFADSEGHPTEQGTLEDGRVSWDWLNERAKKESAPMYVWGHSLGSGVAVQLTGQLSKEGNPPRGLILEAPFNNVSDAAQSHPLAMPFTVMPFFDDHMLHELNYAYRSDYWIKDVTCPVAILHDKSDTIVPFELGQKLCLAAKQHKVNVDCIDIDEQLNHKFIYKSKRFVSIIDEFERRTMK